jgi:hypothetical protein
LTILFSNFHKKKPNPSVAAIGKPTSLIIVTISFIAFDEG